MYSFSIYRDKFSLMKEETKINIHLLESLGELFIEKIMLKCRTIYLPIALKQKVTKFIHEKANLHFSLLSKSVFHPLNFFSAMF